MGETTVFDQGWTQLLKERIPCLFLKCSDKAQVVHVLNAITNHTKHPVYIYYRAHGFVDTQHRRPIAETREFESALAYAKRSFSQKVRKLFVFAELPPLNESKDSISALLIGIQHATLHHRSIILIGTQHLPASLQEQVTMVEVDYNNGVQLPPSLPTRKKARSVDWETETNQHADIGQSSTEDPTFAECGSNELVDASTLPRGVTWVSCDMEKKTGSRFSGLCQWLERKRLYFKARNLRSPRGLVLQGTSGVNWDFALKMIGTAWKTQLYRFDLRVLESMPAAQSQEALHQGLQFLEQTQPCVAWIDNLEQMLQWPDGQEVGKSSRLLIDLMYWLEKRESKVFVVLTVNQVENLPPEIFKLGHFDEMFYLMLPGIQERRDTIEQQIQQMGLPTPSCTCLDRITNLANGMLVEEIAQTIEQAAKQLNHRLTPRKVDSIYEAIFNQRLNAGFTSN